MLVLVELTFLIGTLTLSCNAAPTDVQNNCTSPPQMPNAGPLDEWDSKTYPPGHVVNYGCHPGYVRQGPIKKICTLGKWESLSRGLCIKRKCGHPGDIDFGTFVLKDEDEFVFGAVVEYSCDAGYQMASRYNSVVCTATGWSRERPHCEVLLCPPVIDVNLKILTTVYDDEYTIGNVINFECKNPQHKLYGPSHIFCTSAGTWNADPPTCKTPVCPPVKLDDSVVLSSPHRNEYPVGHILNIQCINQNFRLNGPPELRCTSEGKWNTDPPTCTGSCTVNENEMRNNKIQLKYNQAPTVQHGGIVEFDCIREHEISNNRHLRVSCNGGLLVYPTCHISGSCTVNENEMRNRGLQFKHYQARTVKHGAYVDFDCAPGYESSIYLREYCWNGEMRYPSCYKTSCTVNENEMRNRGIQLKYNKTPTVNHNTYVEFDCAPGYERPYNTHLVKYCIRGVLEYPTCRRSDSCTLNEDEMINHGLQLKYDQARIVQHRAVVEFVCAPGYRISNPSNLQVYCNEGQLTYPTCHRTGSCIVNEDEIMNHGLQLKYDQSRIVQHDDIVEFVCAPGYRISNPSNLEVYCNEGQLTYPTCQRTVIEQDCSQPPTVQNGDITGIRKLSYTSGSSVQYQCANYYKLEGKAKISCQNGEWEKEPICREPCIVTNASMTQNNIRLKYKGDQKLYSEHLDTILFNCIPDYEISDASLLRIQCLDGELNYPKCTKKAQGTMEKPCPPPPEVLSGELSESKKQSYASRSTVEFKCISYYKLQGKPKIKCQDGIWETPPVCLDPCIINDKYLRGNSTQTKDNKKYWIHDETVIFQCLRGFYLETGQLKPKCKSGELVYPKCVKREPCIINEKYLRGNSTQIKGNKKSWMHDETVIFQCLSSFYLATGQLKAKCNNGELVYPKCVKGAETPKCVVNMNTINENHIMITSSHCNNLGKKQVCRIQQNKSIQFKCKRGFSSSGSTPLEGKCQNGVIEYPKCINTITERTTIQPLVTTEVTDRRTF